MSAMKWIQPLRKYLWLWTLSLLVVQGCASGPATAPTETTADFAKRVGRIRFTIQVGAFGNMDNAVRLTLKLQNQGLNAYHFVDPSGLYKVRFGNYATRKTAELEARTLQARGLIDEFYIVSPRPAGYAVDVQQQLVETARSFIGIRYKWGGESIEEGFDCSGLTMTVYQLNGLDLPRTSRQQWRVGAYIARHQLEEGDLVFFATKGRGRISHVGIYAGNNRFIHAPGRGKKIRYASLSNRYYRNKYVGARRYL